MRLGSILPPPAGEDDPGPPPLEATDDLFPSFEAVRLPRRPAAVTFREAVLGSLLLHSILLFAAFFWPGGIFRSGATPIFARIVPEEERISMAFVQDLPRPPEPNPGARLGSDRDRRRGQEEENPEAEEIGPFSTGNTPAMIAEGELAPPAREPLYQPPSPPPVQEEPGQADEPAMESPIAEAREEGGLLQAETGDGRFRVPPSREESGSPSESSRQLEKGQRLRQTLSRMEAGGSIGTGGGAPYRFDSPTAGLSTPSGTLSFDTKGFDWGPYARRIYWIIWTNWHSRMPPAIYTGVKGAVTVRFIIEKDGALSGIRILSPSGVPAYDNAATLALEASNPLPPLPESFPRESEGVTGRFLYNMWR